GLTPWRHTRPGLPFADAAVTPPPPPARCRHAEKLLDVRAFNTEAYGDAVCRLRNILFPEGEIGPWRNHVPVVVRECEVIPCRPPGKTEANFGVGGHVNHLASTFSVVPGEAPLPLAVGLDRGQRALFGFHLNPLLFIP